MKRKCLGVEEIKTKRQKILKNSKTVFLMELKAILFRKTSS